MKREDQQLYLETEEKLLSMRDPKNADFLSALLPDIETSTVLGIRSPVLRKFAASLKEEGKDGVFLSVLPHRYLDENLIHAYLISAIRDYETCMKELERFLPFTDNWAVTDSIRPNVIKKHRDETEAVLFRWLTSEHPYTVRTSVGFFMAYYLEEGFRREQMEQIAAQNSDHYYVHMAIAWYMATALAKQPEAAMDILQREVMDERTHNRTIQKACESFRVSDDMKQMLRTMKRRKP